MWGLDEATQTAAKWITAIAVALATAWKIRLRLRRDTRQDNAGEAAEDGYEAIVAQLTAHVARLDKVVADMGERLNLEMRRRYECEAVNEGLRVRITNLETELRAIRILRGSE